MKKHWMKKLEKRINTIQMILEFLANFAALLKLKNLTKLPYKADLTGFENMSGLYDTAKNNSKIIYPNCSKLFKIGKNKFIWVWLYTKFVLFLKNEITFEKRLIRN